MLEGVLRYMTMHHTNFPPQVSYRIGFGGGMLARAEGCHFTNFYMQTASISRCHTV